ncbi:unnamed protein product [Trichogramma brassicae]|uniref:Fibronectin type-III domain-containing protein n=1 Tax=Trichogramma brassicae TaxID=86971 RepID=A0A6H5I705_9HYME|nr:unnamed protein product [Trichogramma brassicae]
MAWSTRKEGHKQQHSSSRRRRTSSSSVDLAGGLLFIAALSLLVSLGEQCAVGLTTPGRTWPVGDIAVEHGKPLNITCVLNETFIARNFPGKTSADLVFFKGQHEVDSQYIHVLNETSIMLNITNPPPENEMYYCKLRLDKRIYHKEYEAVCLNKVAVGFKPRKPKNFNCYSMNWENLTCSWDPPENFVDTTYQITFKLPGRAASRKLYPCPEPAKDEVRLNRNSCTWKPKTNPIYRQPYEFYTFYINGTNVLGTWNGSYKFHHFAHVIPARPSNLTVVNKTLNSAMLYWSVAYPMQNFPPGLHHRIAHQSQWEDRDSWQNIDINDEPHNPNRYYNLTGLKYANSIYDVRVYVKSAVAEGDDMWSNFSGITFRTPATVPGQPPITDLGSFEVTDGNNASRDIYLYWQSIPAYLENGDHFRYQVINVMENKRKVHLVPNETTRTYAKFRGLSMNNNYNFEIVSTNDVGALEIPANIFVPSKENLPKEPVAFTKIAFDDGLYELSWKPPVSGLADINNYTIFWCENDRDRPYQCQGYLDWKHVPSDTLIHNVTVPDPKRVYQFAISANTDHGSSGMMWASCTVIHNKVVGKMKTVWINRVESEAIEVGWKLDCSDRIGIVDGFRIYYCPITSPYNLTCRSPKMNKTVDNNVNSIGGRIAELKPYTTYMISVAVITKNGEGHASDPLYNTTYEARPESPRNVNVTRVTNTSMTVEWEDPVHMNGVLRYYIVHYNDLFVKAGRAKTFNLTGLLPYKQYSVQVSACTVSCSNVTATTPVEVMTDIGVPDQIIPPTVRFVNSSQVRIKWSVPSHAAGPSNFYQIKGVDDKIFTTTEQEALLSIPDCKSDTDERLYKFQVRAVNKKPDGEYLYGNWSEAGEGNCYNGGLSFTVMVIIYVVGIVCGIALMYLLAYGSRKAWKKYKHMQDVDITLPPGLAHELAPDVKLLNKGEQKQRPLPPRPSSANASTGQESPSASLNSEETHMSNDSGNDEVPILNPKKMAIKSEKNASDKWDSPHLRQRNVSNASKPGSVDTLNKRDWDVYSGKTIKSSNETLQTTVSPSQADTLSLTKSSPDMSEGVYPKLNGSSTSDYISMPRSTEMLNGHISMISPTMGLPPYCAVGMIPKSLTNKSMNGKNEETLGVAVPYVQVGLMDTFTGDLSSIHEIKSETKSFKNIFYESRVERSAVLSFWRAGERLAPISHRIQSDEKKKLNYRLYIINSDLNLEHGTAVSEALVALSSEPSRIASGQVHFSRRELQNAYLSERSQDGARHIRHGLLLGGRRSVRSHPRRRHHRGRLRRRHQRKSSLQKSRRPHRGHPHRVRPGAHQLLAAPRPLLEQSRVRPHRLRQATVPLADPLSQSGAEGAGRGLPRPSAATAQREIRHGDLALRQVYPAEDYHQKYRLQGHAYLVEALGLKSALELQTSPLAAKLNGFVAGAVSPSEFEEQVKSLELSDKALQYVRKHVIDNQGSGLYC